MSLLRTTLLDTVSADVMMDIELSGNNTEADYLKIYNWYLSGSDQLSNSSYVPTNLYPFTRYTEYEIESDSAYAPFAKFTYTPIITSGGGQLTACLTIDDPTIPDDISQCRAYDLGSYDIVPSSPVQLALLNLTDNKASATRVETILLQNQDVVEYINTDIVWTDSYSLTSVQTISHTGDTPVFNNTVNGVGVTYTADTNGLSASYNFPTETAGNKFKNRYKIINKLYPINYPSQDFNNFPTNVITSTGTINSETVVKTIPSTDIGSIGYIALSGENDDIYSYKITTAHNATNVGYNTEENKIGSNNHIVAARLNGSDCEVYITPSADVIYTCYFYDLSSNNSTNNSFSAVNIESDTPLVLNNNTKYPNYNQYGEKWVLFIKDENDDTSQIHELNSAWSSEQDMYTSNSSKTTFNSLCEVNLIVDELQDGSTGIKVTQINDSISNNYIDIAGFSGVSPLEQVTWSNYNRDTANIQIIDSFDRSSSNACTWNIVNNIHTYDHTYKSIVYSVWDDNSLEYNTRDIINTGKLDLYDSVKLGVSSDGNTVFLYASAYDNYSLEGLRTQVNNISSFTVYDEDPIHIDSSPYEANIWTVYCSGSPGSVLVDVYSNYDNYNVDIRSAINTAGFNTTGFNFTVSLSDSAYYALQFEPTFDTTSEWVVSGYRIDSREAQSLYNGDVDPLIDSDILSFSADDQYLRHNSTWWIKNSFDNIYSTFLTDIIWTEVLNQANYSSFYIANSSSVYSDAIGDIKGYAPLTNITYTSTFDGDYVKLKGDADISADIPYKNTIGGRWNVQGFDFTKHQHNISTSFNTAASFITGETFNYIFSHPNNYSITLSMSTNEELVHHETIDNHATVLEVSPSASIQVSLSSIDTLDNYYIKYPTVSATSFLSGDLPSIQNVARANNTLHFSTLNTVPGSFPIGELHIDFGDNTGLTIIHKTSDGVGSISDNTYAYELNNLKLDDINTYDPRRYALSHTFPSDKAVYTVSLSAFSADTREMSVDTVKITGFKSVNIIDKPKRLITSSCLTNNNMVYNILIPE